MRAAIIPPEGEIRVEDIDASLDGLQAIVGGDIESVALTGTDLTAYIHGEGKYEGLARNPRATAIAHLFPGDFIAGTMIVLGPVDDEGNDTPLNPSDLGLNLPRYGVGASTTLDAPFRDGGQVG
jgi:hypothetical protein